MKQWLAISLAGNVILALLVLWLVHARPGTAAGVAVHAGPASVARTVLAKPAPDALPAAFRWSRLESPDYRVFIQNLRGIECPESTIRAIVTMDVQDAFAWQRRKLVLEATAPGPWSRSAERRMIASLLGEPTDPAPVASAPSNSEPWQVRLKVKPPAPVLPLIFESVDSDQLNLTAEQQQVIGRLKQQFLDEIGGPNQDPDDPDYLARWRLAQARIDQSLRGLLGSQFYLRFQMAANRAAAP